MAGEDVAVSRRGTIVIAAVVIAVACVAALGWRIERSLATTRAQRAITAYDESLARATARLEPELLRSSASDGEVQRVATYITQLWGEGIELESRLLSLEVLALSRGSGGMTVRVREVWRYTDRDRGSGRLLHAPVRRTQVIEYRLVERNGVLIVDRSTAVGEAIEGPAK